MNDDYLKLLRYALRLTMKKRYTVKEMRGKLEQFSSKHGLGEQLKIVQQVDERLKELKYLDDHQYVLDYLATRAKLRPRGVFAMKRELIKKGVDKSDIETGLGESEVDELMMAALVIEKYNRKLTMTTPDKRKNKLFQHLAAKGFRPDTIYKSIESYYNL